ncbi:MAG: D-3-phosphoglycerate dehydrogenase [uncultured Chloroflexi bacterium]|uniref:D-3-phosphoglycerate dehydrogenase n=1 Tax=uncultured Chloroflexota bacterium TaxID=166587 RepID=A0A6J4H4Q4_9CHLR|nr:MAG: D-3-phosphoglycerate dehydrogenase [uncultured Chloroflexota bacterium]
MAQRVMASARNVAMVLDQFKARLDEAGVEIFFPESKAPTLTEEELVAQLPGCVAALAMPDDYSARVIEAAAPTLKLIARSGVGYDSIDLDAAKKHGVYVTTTVGANHDAVADFTLGLILDLARHLTEITSKVRGGWWGRLAGTELRGKTLGIVGTGRVGREVAARAAGFGMRLVAYDLFPNEDWARGAGVTYRPLEQLLAESDFISLHAPSTAETRHLLNARTLAQAKRGAYVINTARGDLIDEAALVAALDAGQIAGAALDVFANEPPTAEQDPVIKHPKVLPLSHCAGAAVEAQRRAAEIAVEQVLELARGEKPRYVVPELA